MATGQPAEMARPGLDVPPSPVPGELGSSLGGQAWGGKGRGKERGCQGFPSLFTLSAGLREM